MREAGEPHGEAADLEEDWSGWRDSNPRSSAWEAYGSRPTLSLPVAVKAVESRSGAGTL